MKQGSLRFFLIKYGINNWSLLLIMKGRAMNIFKNLTLVKKMTLSFGFVLILLIVIGLLSSSALQTASEGLEQFRALAKEANLIGQIDLLQATFKTAIFKILALSLLAIIIIILAATFITRGLLKMLGGDPAAVMEVANYVTKGNLNVEVPDHGEPKDSLYTGLRMTVGGLGRRAALIQEVADGNLAVDVDIHMEGDLIGHAVRDIVNNMNETLGQIQLSGNQIAERSQDVASLSQALSHGATESASSLEQISASLNELTSQTRSNADNAKQANALANEAREAATAGNKQMEEMVEAMTDINEASQNISKIIKTIDEIAFQTNLLALNAAVEAARAGQHGKGFAVVAEEVRNLAARSAKAAEETSELIEGTVAKTANGSTIANQTAEALSTIVSGISKVTDLVSEISTASSEQAMGVDQISKGINQIDQVTQQNTATAEESAAAAEVLSSQSAHLNQMLNRFTLKNNEKAAQLQMRSDLKDSPEFESFMIES
jgi:methyl-accepting chemotaxis protein